MESNTLARRTVRFDIAIEVPLAADRSQLQEIQDRLYKAGSNQERSVFVQSIDQLPGEHFRYPTPWDAAAGSTRLAGSQR